MKNPNQIIQETIAVPAWSSHCKACDQPGTN